MLLAQLRLERFLAEDAVTLESSEAGPNRGGPGDAYIQKATCCGVPVRGFSWRRDARGSL
jgi:hypothetical protein